MENNLKLEHAQIALRNFAGREGKFNAEGDRNFALILPEDLAEQLTKDGWNVKRFKPRDPDELGSPFVRVAVKYGRISPKVVLVSGDKLTPLDESNIDILDTADIVNVDLIVRPRVWDQETGRVKAYLKTMYVTIDDDFGGKYSDFA